MFDLRKRAFSMVLLLSLGIFVAHLYVALIQPIYYFVDDRTYLAAAFSILDGTKCATAAGNSCNYEHPPLSKLLMALGFEIFGRTQVIGPAVGIGANQFGGRFFNILLGSLSGPALYLVVKRLSGDWKMAFVAALFLLVDPLYFTLASSAELVIPMVFFAILALLPLVYESRIGPVKGSILAGCVLGLSLLSEESAIFVIFAVLSYLLLAGAGNLRAKVWSCVQLGIAAGLVFVMGLELYDVFFTSFPNFLAQLEVILGFHFGAGPGQLSFLTSESNCTQYLGLCPTDKSLIPHFLYLRVPTFSGHELQLHCLLGRDEPPRLADLLPSRSLPGGTSHGQQLSSGLAVFRLGAHRSAAVRSTEKFAGREGAAPRTPHIRMERGL